MTQPIRFYGGKTPFSNFSSHPIIVDGLKYLTTEHYFQSMKFISTDPAYAEEIRLAPTPFKAKILGGSRKHPISKNWNTIRDDVMRVAIFYKALQHKDFFEALLETGDSPLIEAAPKDYYWGEGSNGTGKNMLGKLLVELREKLNEHKEHMYVDWS